MHRSYIANPWNDVLTAALFPLTAQSARIWPGDPMSDTPTPTVSPDEPGYRQLRQVTVRSDDEIEAVNQLLAEGWRVVSIGHRPDAAVYVLGRADKKQKPRTGFLLGD